MNAAPTGPIRPSQGPQKEPEIENPLKKAWDKVAGVFNKVLGKSNIPPPVVSERERLIRSGQTVIKEGQHKQLEFFLKEYEKICKKENHHEYQELGKQIDWMPGWVLQKLTGLSITLGSLYHPQGKDLFKERPEQAKKAGFTRQQAFNNFGIDVDEKLDLKFIKEKMPAVIRNMIDFSEAKEMDKKYFNLYVGDLEEIAKKQ